MPMQQYDYQRNMADLQDKYSQDQATNAYARFISQQRFKRDRETGNQSFQRSFPQAIVGMNRGMGSRIKSGVFGSNMQNYFGDFNKGMAQLDEAEGADQGQFTMLQNQKADAYRRALLLLQEQYAQGRASDSPFATYVGGF